MRRRRCASIVKALSVVHVNTIGGILSYSFFGRLDLSISNMSNFVGVSIPTPIETSAIMSNTAFFLPSDKDMIVTARAQPDTNDNIQGSKFVFESQRWKSDPGIQSRNMEIRCVWTSMGFVRPLTFVSGTWCHAEGVRAKLKVNFKFVFIV